MKTQEDNRAERQARSQMESIAEMVRALDPEKAREAAAKEFTENLSRAKCEKILRDEFEHECKGETIETLRETLAEHITGGFDPEGFDFEFNEDEARERIYESPLSVEVRSGWASRAEDFEPEEYQILLCTGGPAVRIHGQLGQFNEPDTANLEYQDWFTPWERLWLEDGEEEILLRYAQTFYFGE